MVHIALSAFFRFYQGLILIWCILSWFPLSEGSLIKDVAAVIDRLVSPYVNLFRRIIPPLVVVDFSPIIAILALSLIERAILFVMVV